MLIGAALLVALCAVYVVWSYAAWLREFDRNPRRFSRHNVHCPSHGGALPRPAIVAGRRTACDRVCGAVCPVSGRAAALDVDHVHFTRFRDFMWACAVLAPCGAAAFTYGILEHTARSWLRRAGLLFVRHPPCDVAQLAGTLVLESVGLAPGFVGLERDTVNKCCLASFRWKNLLLFDNTGTISTGCELRVTINLTTKKMVDASIDGSAINASEAVIVLSYLTVGAVHTIGHAYANFGVDPDDHSDSFANAMACATVLYNYLGTTYFPRILAAFRPCGWIRHSCIPEMPPKFMAAACEGGMYSHGDMLKLMPYSRAITFIVKARKHFMAEFANHEFPPHINPEALFIGTVQHSIDHTLFARNLRDYLWLDINHSRFGAMAELTSIIRACFVEELPFVCIAKNFKDAPRGSFFRNVYERVASVDFDLANQMEAGIIR